jgi:prolyl 4-hydroxylase
MQFFSLNNLVMWWVLIVIILILILLFRPKSPIEFKEIPNFLTHEECDVLIKMSEPKLVDSMIYGSESDDVITESRVSKQCWFRNENQLVEKISHKCASATSTNKNCQEELQVVKYAKGGFFVPHFDPCEGDEQFCERMNHGSGHRKYTVLVYLNDDFEGGETEFPVLKKSVKPEKGKAVIFRSVDDNGNIIPESKHGGNPVTQGEKWVCNKWIHFKEFRH